ncbi:hypothetical protein Afil01_66310 [Actinorhabdospora filicis]|uniref:Peptidase S8/S53 domain-containing protein n=1 Tax=Actinorhabdospora filicis TaxID=1785913 RepID=A0A9W6SS01_9ACTN|nr:type VII secretion-associated serine protease mycosin [Actinorhabdospora filicis]GLZ81824.1 hypothetical protein Afil01_66310 [Actinorhabdospora filicis]
MSREPLLSRRTAALALAASLLGLTGTIAVPGQASAANQCGPEVTAPLSDKQWELKRLQPEKAWPLSEGEGQVVAVIDSGVSNQPTQLAPQVLDGKDYVGSDAHCDNVPHGTIIAGIIAAAYNEKNPQYYGIAPKAKILPIRVAEDSSKFAQDENSPKKVADAIRWAVDKKATIINLSLRTDDTPELRSAVQYARQNDVVMVAASGNTGENLTAGATVYPAAYDGVIGVGSVDQNGAWVGTSNPAWFVDVAAPGSEITGIAPRGNGYGVMKDGGTSFATGFVSGTAALVRSYYKDLTADQVIERIEATADSPPGGWSKEFGYGVVNPYRAVASLDGKLAGAPRTVGSEQISAPQAPVDPLRGMKIAASLTAAGAVAVTIVLLSAFLVRRHVRRRAAGARTAQP